MLLLSSLARHEIGQPVATLFLPNKLTLIREDLIGIKGCFHRLKQQPSIIRGHVWYKNCFAGQSKKKDPSPYSDKLYMSFVTSPSLFSFTFSWKKKHIEHRDDSGLTHH